MNISNVYNSSTAPSLGRYLAQPKNRLGTTFQRVMDVAGAVVGKAASLTGVDGDYASLLQQQIELQHQMMKVTMISNVERTRHETSMASVRNMRVA